jgi:hypothetical protein
MGEGVDFYHGPLSEVGTDLGRTWGSNMFVSGSLLELS